MPINSYMILPASSTQQLTNNNNTNAPVGAANGQVITIKTKNDLDQFIKQLRAMQNQSPVIVAVTATWCGHCRQFLPTYDQVATEFSNAQSQQPQKVKFYNIETDSIGLQKLPVPFNNVSGFPTMYKLYKNSITPLQGSRDPASLWTFFSS